MEQVFFRLHVRLIRFVTPLLMPSIRKLLEKFVLMNAILSLCLLVWLHMMYVNPSESAQSNCLYQELLRKNMTGNVAQFDVIKLHISNDWMSQFPAEGYESDRKERCDGGGQCHATKNSRGIEKLPLLFDSFISSIGMHITDSQHSTPKSNGRGGGSARLFSVAERFLSGPGLSASTGSGTGITNTENNDESQFDMNFNPDESLVEGVSLDESTTSITEGLLGIKNENENINGNVGKGTTTTEIGSLLMDLFVSQRVYLFSLEKGYLMLHPNERDRHDIKRLDLTIARDNICFGPRASAWLVHSFIGYDTVVMNWAISTFGGKGYLYNIYSKELFNLNFAADFVDRTGAEPVENIKGNINKSDNFYNNNNNNNNNDNDKKKDYEKDKKSILSLLYHWIALLTQRTRGGKLVQFTFGGLSHFISFKIGVIFSTLFLFFTTTTLVSFTLRETQERMLKFTFLLQHHVSHRIPYASLVFTHVVESLVFVPIMVS